MSQTTTRQHLDNAASNMENIQGTHPIEVTKAGAAVTQANATMALASAQHTANRIAWLQRLTDTGQMGGQSQSLVEQIEMDLA